MPPARRSLMGVCPQFDVLWGELTGQEHLHIYGRVKVRRQPGASLAPALQPAAGHACGGPSRRSTRRGLPHATAFWRLEASPPHLGALLAAAAAGAGPAQGGGAASG